MLKMDALRCPRYSPKLRMHKIDSPTIAWARKGATVDCPSKFFTDTRPRVPVSKYEEQRASVRA